MSGVPGALTPDEWRKGEVRWVRGGRVYALRASHGAVVLEVDGETHQFRGRDLGVLAALAQSAMADDDKRKIIAEELIALDEVSENWDRREATGSAFDGHFAARPRELLRNLLAKLEAVFPPDRRRRI